MFTNQLFLLCLGVELCTAKQDVELCGLYTFPKTGEGLENLILNVSSSILFADSHLTSCWDMNNTRLHEVREKLKYPYAAAVS